MSELPIVEILRVGLSGLVFLLAMMSFRLLSAEQKKDEPDKKMLGTIRSFSWICVLLAIIVAATGIIDSVVRRNLMVANISPSQIRDCRDSIERLDSYAALPGATAEGLRNHIGLHIEQCEPIVEQLEAFYAGK